MKKLLVVTVLILSLGSVFAQNNSTPKKPDIFFTEMTFDFGQIADNKPVQHDYIFFNSGTAPLLLKNVKPSCGCTTPVWTRQPVKPGESGKISVTFDPKGDAGKAVNKTITVTTNIPEKGQDKTVTLYIKGKVVSGSETVK
jgi:hypothetical protein